MNTSGAEDHARAIWIAANAHPNREQVAEHHLRNQGYGPYVPVMRKQIRHARQVRDVLRPLFPGYLFVHLSPAHRRWRPILSTVGIRSVVCAGDVPCVVPESFIDDLKQREQDGVTVGAVVPISTVKSEVGVNALGFVTTPVHVRFDPVEVHPGGCAAASPIPMIMLSASAEMKQGGAKNADPKELRHKGWRLR